jgi:hypothetical protein
VYFPLSLLFCKWRRYCDDEGRRNREEVMRGERGEGRKEGGDKEKGSYKLGGSWNMFGKRVRFTEDREPFKQGQTFDNWYLPLCSPRKTSLNFLRGFDNSEAILKFGETFFVSNSFPAICNNW